MHEPLLSRAALPAPTIVLGLTLRPYSIGHELYLIREQNAIATGGKPRQSDLAQAALICCNTWAENQKLCRDLLFPIKAWAWKRRARKCIFEVELEAFKDYRAEGSLSFPPSGISRHDSTPGTPPGAPFVLRIYQHVISHRLASPATAWDYPMGLGVMQWQCHWESEGRLEIYNEDEAEHDRYVAEEEAKAGRGK